MFFALPMVSESSDEWPSGRSGRSAVGQTAESVNKVLQQLHRLLWVYVPCRPDCALNCRWSWLSFWVQSKIEV